MNEISSKHFSIDFASLCSCYSNRYGEFSKQIFLTVQELRALQLMNRGLVISKSTLSLFFDVTIEIYMKKMIEFHRS